MGNMMGISLLDFPIKKTYIIIHKGISWEIYENHDKYIGNILDIYIYRWGMMVIYHLVFKSWPAGKHPSNWRFFFGTSRQF